MERTPAQSPERSYHEAGEIVFSRIAKPTTAPEDTCDRIMASSHEQLPTTGRSSDDLTGLDVLLVEDSWDVGQAVKALLELCRATVAGPAATIADAEVLLARHLTDVAIVDLHLRGGERSDSLIGRLREQGVPIIMLSGSFELASLPPIEGAIIQAL